MIKIGHSKEITGYMLRTPRIMVGNEKLITPYEDGSFALKSSVYTSMKFDDWLAVYSDFLELEQIN
jgi:hypothetical protein